MLSLSTESIMVSVYDEQKPCMDLKEPEWGS